jgi:transposase
MPSEGSSDSEYDEDAESRGRTALSLLQKYLIVTTYIPSGTCTHEFIAKKHGVDRTTISKLFSRKHEIIRDYQCGIYRPSSKRKGSPEKEALDLAVRYWFQEFSAAHKDQPIQSIDIYNKATVFASSLGRELDIKPLSKRWVEKWRKRWKITLKPAYGDAASAPTKDIDNWLETTLPTILTNFKPQDIFNCDQTGLFWKALPETTLTPKGKKVQGWVQSKDRVTVHVCCSLTGEKVELLVIGYSHLPRVFKGHAWLPVLYESNSSAWLTSIIFLRFLARFNAQLAMRSRNVALILDNFSAHHVDFKPFVHITPYYLPPRTTTHLQPLDGGIINCLKFRYKMSLSSLRLTALEHPKVLFSWTLWHCIESLSRIWKKMDPNIIVHCFRHCWNLPLSGMLLIYSSAFFCSPHLADLPPVRPPSAPPGPPKSLMRLQTLPGMTFLSFSFLLSPIDLLLFFFRFPPGMCKDLP